MKVMVVDDSALYRKTIADVLAEDPAIEVVGSAPNGRIAMMKIPELQPDMLTLDMEMPEMDGIATLRELTLKHPRIKSVVFSAHTEKGAELTLDALRLGAVDFVTKPSGGQSIELSMRKMREELLPKLQALTRNRQAQMPRRQPLARHSGAGLEQKRTMQKLLPRDVIAIGVSTGGPPTLHKLFTQFPRELKQAVLIVQHMPPIFTKKLAEQLDKVGRLPVHEARAGEPVRPGHAYIAPGDYHMEVADRNGVKAIHLHQKPPENFCRPAVDVLFRSVAKSYGERAIGVILTGMGEDGMRGMQVMKEAGIPIIAQDAETSVVWGMPGAVVQAGLADEVVPIEKVYQTISEFII